MHLIAHGSEKRVAAQDVGLVAYGHALSAVARRARALAREIEGESRDALGTAARDDQCVRGEFPAQHDAAASTGIEALCVFPDDHVIDATGLTRLERRKIPLVETYRPDIGVEIKPETQSQVQVIADFRAIRIGHAGHPGRTVQDRVGTATRLVSLVRKHIPGAHIVVCAARQVLERQQPGAAGALQHAD